MQTKQKHSPRSLLASAPWCGRLPLRIVTEDEYEYPKMLVSIKVNAFAVVVAFVASMFL